MQRQIVKEEKAEGVCPIAPESIQKGKEDCYEKLQEVLNDDEEFLKQVHIDEDENENLQSITGKSDITLPVLKEEQGERDEFIGK